MDIKTFTRVLKSFAEDPEQVQISKGTVVMQMGADFINASLIEREGDLFVSSESGEEASAARWIALRLARLDLLARRILSYTPEVADFVTPSGTMLPEIERVTKDESSIDVTDAVSALAEFVNARPGGLTSVLYLTSEAGEGKTSLIAQLARQQAVDFIAHKSNWLVLPVPLGGRGFLRLDDVVVAALVNRFRFQRLYYDSFLELIKLGYIVPAFDGFEEAFIEAASGEAVSALGSLVESLDSQGSVLVSARKAYFEYRSFLSQARLFDAIGEEFVSFSKLALHRWTKAPIRGVRPATGSAH